MYYFPDIEDTISLSSPLHAIEFEKLKPVPVIMVGWKFGGFNFPCKITLDVLESIDQFRVSRVPKDAVVLGSWVHKLFQESQHNPRVPG